MAASKSPCEELPPIKTREETPQDDNDEKRWLPGYGFNGKWELWGRPSEEEKLAEQLSPSERKWVPPVSDPVSDVACMEVDNLNYDGDKWGQLARFLDFYKDMSLVQEEESKKLPDFSCVQEDDGTTECQNKEQCSKRRRLNMPWSKFDLSMG